MNDASNGLPVRRKFLRDALRGAAGGAAAVLSASGQTSPTGSRESNSRAVQNAIHFGNQFVSWQSPYGGPDPARCPYRSRGRFSPTQLHSTGPMTRALYHLFDRTGIAEFKAAADRYAVFHMSVIRDPYEPHTDEVALHGSWRNLVSRAWVYGKALAPCYEEFRLHNPAEDAFDIKAYSCHRWLQTYRRSDSYFGIGYSSGTGAAANDGQFSCDLGEVGNGLVGLYNASRYRPALEDATGLARYFLTEWQSGSGRGVWSSRIGMWLVGPWSLSGGEHFTNQLHDTSAWIWSACVDGEYLIRLRGFVEDAALRSAIDEKTVQAFRWCYDACQFEDGAHGMFGRDDKWAGMSAAALLLYAALKRAGTLPAAVERQYQPKVEKAWQWLVINTTPDRFPADGYIRVNGTTTKKPLENLAWAMAWTVDALLEGSALFPG
jgi:hypothetical protein